MSLPDSIWYTVAAPMSPPEISSVERLAKLSSLMVLRWLSALKVRICSKFLVEYSCTLSIKSPIAIYPLSEESAVDPLVFISAVQGEQDIISHSMIQ
jgi:hypothetical protein